MTDSKAGTEPGDDNALSLRGDIFQLGRKSMAYVVGHLGTRAISFLLLPLYTNALSPADYGVLSLAFTFAAFSLVIFHFGINTALLKFYTGEPPHRQREVFSTVYFTQLGVIAVLASAFLLGRRFLAPLLLGVNRPDWMVILIAIIVMDTLWAHPMIVLRARGRAVGYAGLSLLNVATIMTGNIILVAVFDLGITGALLSNLMASTLLFVVNLPTVWKQLSLAAFSKGTLGQLLRFGLPFLPAGLFTMIMELSDRYLLRWLTDMETVGLYSAGYKLGLFMLLLIGGFSLGWQPFFLQRGKAPDAPVVFARIATYLLAGLGWVLLTISAWIDLLVRMPIGPITIFGPEYWSATGIVPVVLLAYYFYAMYVLQLPGIMLTQRTAWVMLFRGSGAVANVGLNLLLIPWYGAMGAAWATCLGFALMAALTFTVNHRHYPVPYEWGRLARLAALLLTGFLVLIYWPAGLGRNLALTVWVPLGLIASRAMTPGEWGQIKSLVRSR
ncbi:MAG: oligosaccharide flippase family protein [Candidatus Marinimicrobia bacterium]|nr:oligosaccharide flippase family protein [Candidatus Neomarinimicrobiota bacterium]